MHKITHFTDIYVLLTSGLFFLFFIFFFINQFLSLSACLINEYAMMENKLLGVLRTWIKLTEK